MPHHPQMTVKFTFKHPIQSIPGLGYWSMAPFADESKQAAANRGHSNDHFANMGLSSAQLEPTTSIPEFSRNTAMHIQSVTE
jgi:hypothetical protein